MLVFLNSLESGCWRGVTRCTSIYSGCSGVKGVNLMLCKRHAIIAFLGPKIQNEQLEIVSYWGKLGHLLTNLLVLCCDCKVDSDTLSNMPTSSLIHRAVH